MFSNKTVDCNNNNNNSESSMKKVGSIKTAKNKKNECLKRISKKSNNFVSPETFLKSPSILCNVTNSSDDGSTSSSSPLVSNNDVSFEVNPDVNFSFHSPLVSNNDVSFEVNPDVNFSFHSDNAKQENNNNVGCSTQTWNSIDQFEQIRQLGKGGFAVVYLVKDKKTKRLYAMKKISRQLSRQLQSESQLIREIEVHMSLDHPNIVKLLGLFQDSTSVYLILEYCPYGNLFVKLKVQANKRFNENSAANYILELTKAVKYLHERGIVHRDIKPENLLLGKDKKLKLADFGLCVYARQDIHRLPPEMCAEGFPVNDVWCIGVLAYELLVGHSPFFAETELKTFTNILKLNINYPKYLSKDAREFLSKILVIKPENRLTLEGILNHPWITKHTRSNVFKPSNRVRSAEQKASRTK